MKLFKFLSVLCALAILGLTAPARAAYVQSLDFGSFYSNGSAGPALLGVVSGHAMFGWLWFNGNTAPGITSITDSAGTTWATSGPVVVLTGGATCMVTIVATSAVTSGTHTLTVNYTGALGYTAILIEDSLSSFRAAAIGQLVANPTTGQTLTPGGSVGSSGDLVYMVGLTDATSAANTSPVAGSGGFTIPAGLTSTNINIGAWSAGYNASAGGTTPSFAPGSAGNGNETAVLSIALSSGGASGASRKILLLNVS